MELLVTHCCCDLYPGCFCGLCCTHQAAYSEAYTRFRAQKGASYRMRYDRWTQQLLPRDLRSVWYHTKICENLKPGIFVKFLRPSCTSKAQTPMCISGILVEALELGSKVRSLAGNDLFIFSALRVQRCHIQLPNLHQPLYMQILGAHAELTQRQLPEVLICKCMRSC